MANNKEKSRVKCSAFIILASIGILLNNCATRPPTGENLIRETRNIKLPAYPTKKYAVIYIIRPGTTGEKFNYDIYVDDPDNKKKYAGHNKGGQYIFFYLSSGKHRIYSHADNGAWIDIDAAPGRIYFIEQVPGPGILRGTNTVRFVDLYTGKWWTKKLKTGTIVRKYH